MRKFLWLLLVACAAAQVPTTPNLHFNVPVPGTQYGSWGPLENINWENADSYLSGGLTVPSLAVTSLSAASIVDTGIGTTPNPAPICANGTGGALTNVGCTGGSSSYSFFGNTTNPLTALSDPTTIIDGAGNDVAFASTGLQLDGYTGALLALDNTSQVTTGFALVDDSSNNSVSGSSGLGGVIVSANAGTVTLHASGNACVLSSSGFSCSAPVTYPSGANSVQFVPYRPTNPTFLAVGDSVNVYTETGTLTKVAPTATSNFGIQDAITGSGLSSWYGYLQFYGGRNITFGAAVTVSSLTSSSGVFFTGITDNPTGWSGSGAQVPTGNVIGFYTEGGHWFAIVGNGSSYTTTDTGVAGVGSRAKLSFILTSSNLVFLVNGTVVATVTTNIPTTASAMVLDTAAQSGSSGITVTFEPLFAVQPTV